MPREIIDMTFSKGKFNMPDGVLAGDIEKHLEDGEPVDGNKVVEALNHAYVLADLLDELGLYAPMHSVIRMLEGFRPGTIKRGNKNAM